MKTFPYIVYCARIFFCNVRRKIKKFSVYIDFYFLYNAVCSRTLIGVQKNKNSNFA